MDEKNIKILEDTLTICKNGYYFHQNKEKKLKLSYGAMTQCRVFLPQEITELSFKGKKRLGDGACCRFSCENTDSFSLACKRSKENKIGTNDLNDEKILVLNLANAVNAGGGVRRGAHAQEEDLCRASSLLVSLESPNARSYYEYNRSLNTKMGSDAVVITPLVEIIKARDGGFLDESVVVSVVTCAAPCLRFGMEGLSSSQYEEMVYNRVIAMLKCAAYTGYKKLVLGAFGCGAFYNDAKQVSDIFYKAIKNFSFDGATIDDIFSQIDFAVLSQDVDEYNFREFYRNFGGDNFYRQDKKSNQEESKYVLFWHEYEKNGCFSSWYTSPFVIGGITYQHVEQYLMAQKALLFKDFDIYNKILKEPSPEKCKKLGREVENFDIRVWCKYNYGILLKGVTAKFTQNRELKKLLLDTGDKIIAEASPYDSIYGIGLKATEAERTNPDEWPGQNLLGKALMEVRSQLKKSKSPLRLLKEKLNNIFS